MATDGYYHEGIPVSRHSNSRSTRWCDIFSDPANPRHASIAREMFSPKYKTLPKTRGDCTHKRSAKRPCLYFRCRFHVALDSCEGYGIIPSGALVHANTGCVLDFIDERGDMEQNLPSGGWTFKASEIEEYLGLAHRTPHEVMASESIKEAFLELYEDFYLGGNELTMPAWGHNRQIREDDDRATKS